MSIVHGPSSHRFKGVNDIPVIFAFNRVKGYHLVSDMIVIAIEFRLKLKRGHAIRARLHLRLMGDELKKRNPIHGPEDLIIFRLSKGFDSK